MSGIFNLDNAFFRIMTKVCYGALLSLLWLLCSIPLVTAGAAAAALSDVMLKLVRDEEGYILRSFFKAFASHFKKATAVWLIALAGFVVIGGDIIFFARMGNWPGTICAGVFFMVMVAMGLVMTLVFHYLVWFGGTVKLVLMDSFKVSLGYLPYSAALLILAAAMGYAIYVSVPLMIVFTFFGMGIFSYISAYLWRRVFDKAQSREDAS